MTDRRAEWLRERRDLITASDVAAILGEDRFRGALAVYAEKVEGIEPEETPRMRRGRRLEPVIAAEYADDTGRPVFLGAHGPYELTRHPSIPWLAATLDRETEGSEQTPAPAGVTGRAPLELKAVIDGASVHEWDGDEAPTGYEIQLQIQIACRGVAWGSLAGFMPYADTLAVRDRLRDDGFLEVAYPVLEDFRDRVKTGRPPEADGLAGTTAAVRRLWGRGDGETVPLDHEALALVEKWERFKVVRDDAGDQVDELDNRLRQRIAGATFGALPDGSFLTLKPYGKGRALRRWWPRIRRRTT